MSTGEVPVVRSIVAVGAGFFTVMVLGAADITLSQMSPMFDPAAGHARSDSALFIKLAYETAFAVLAGYITARIAATNDPLSRARMAGLVLIGRSLISIAAWDVTPPWFNHRRAEY